MSLKDQRSPLTVVCIEENSLLDHALIKVTIVSRIVYRSCFYMGKLGTKNWQYRGEPCLVPSLWHYFKNMNTNMNIVTGMNCSGNKSERAHQVGWSHITL